MSQNKKCILLVGNHLSHSGQNRSVGEELAFQLTLTGWQSILVSRRRNKLVRLIDMVWLIFYRRNDYLVAQVDVFSGRAFLWAFLCSMEIKLLGKPLILVLHGGNLPGFSKRYSLWVKKLLIWGNVVISPSTFLQEKMLQYRKDIQLIPNGIDIHKYTYFEREKPKPNLVWLRAFHEIYNPSLVPKLISILQEMKLNCHILMIGPDKKDGSLQRMLQIAKVLAVKDFIEIMPGVPNNEVPVLLNRGDIFINTTNFDNTPVSVIEAMACGLCIVSTNVGGIPKLLENGTDGLLVHPDDSIEMAKTVRRILVEPGLAQTLSSKARKKAEQFDWSVVLPMWEALWIEAAK